MSDEITAAVWGEGRRNLTVGLLLTVSMAAFEALAVATVLPAVVSEIGGLDWYGWVFSAFMLANLLSITAAGQAADRRGVAVPFVAGSGLFVLGLIGAGTAQSMPWLVISRVAQGLGAGAISAVAYVAIALGYPAAARPRLMAMLSSAWVVPGLIGPALAGFVADHLHWRWVFLGLAPPTLIASALAVPSLRRLQRPATATPSEGQTLASLRLAIGAAAMMFGLSLGELAIALPATVLGGALGLPALRQLLPLGTLRAAPGLPAAVACVGLLGFAFFAAEAFLPLSLTEVRGQTATASGLALTAATVTWTAGAWTQAHLATRAGGRVIVRAGLLLIIVGVSGIALATLTPVAIALAVLAWGIAGLGMGLGYSAATLAVLEQAAPGQEGSASAAAQLANVLGTALGTGIGGTIVAAATTHLASAVALVDLTAIAAASVAVVAAGRLPALAR
ncbi:MAG TPA: MFS transporter [Terriglobales bacterium]|nr:MFS transporter [Terriglobales bacterium]